MLRLSIASLGASVWHTHVSCLHQHRSRVDAASRSVFVQVADSALAVPSESHAPLSDHIPKATDAWPRESLPAHRRPIPSWATLTDEYAEKASAAGAAAVPAGLHPPARYLKENEGGASQGSGCGQGRGPAQRRPLTAGMLPAGIACVAGGPCHRWPAHDQGAQDWPDVLGGLCGSPGPDRMRSILSAAISRTAQPQPAAAAVTMGRPARGERKRRASNPARTATARWTKLGTAPDEADAGPDGSGSPGARGPDVDSVANVARLREYWVRQFVPVGTNRRLAGAFARTFTPKFRVADG